MVDGMANADYVPLESVETSPEGENSFDEARDGSGGWVVPVPTFDQQVRFVVV